MLDLAKITSSPPVSNHPRTPTIVAIAADALEGGGAVEPVIEVPSSPGPHSPNHSPIVSGLIGVGVFLTLAAMIVPRIAMYWFNNHKAKNWMGRSMRTPRKHEK